MQSIWSTIPMETSHTHLASSIKVCPALVSPQSCLPHSYDWRHAPSDYPTTIRRPGHKSHTLAPPTLDMGGQSHGYIPHDKTGIPGTGWDQQVAPGTPGQGSYRVMPGRTFGTNPWPQTWAHKYNRIISCLTVSSQVFFSASSSSSAYYEIDSVCIYHVFSHTTVSQSLHPFSN